MKVIALLAAVFFTGQTQTGKLYEHPPSNIKFTLPGTSKLTKKRGDWTIAYNVAAGPATLKIFSISFGDEAWKWEATQKYFAEQQRLIFIESSQEEILGVPLMLAKMQETATLDRKITLSGIVYAATDWKFSFRLTASEAAFPEAEARWREAMQSFATIDGRLPEPERKGRAPEASAAGKKPAQAPEMTRTTIGAAKTEKPPIVIGESKIACSTAGRKLELAAPKGWAWTEKDGAFLIAPAEGGFQASVRVASTLDSPTMTNALNEAAIKGLSEFAVVKKREETQPKENTAGSRVIRISREGDSPTGPLFVIMAGGEKGDFYWLLEWRSTAKPTPAQLATLQALSDGLSVEIAP